MGAKHRKNNTSPKYSKKYIIIMIIIIVIIICIFVLGISTQNRNKNKTDEIIGTWTTDEVTVYEFDGKGNGKLILPSSQYNFTYTLNENIIHIDFESEKATDSDYIYSLDEGKLILNGTNTTAGTYTFTKK